MKNALVAQVGFFVLAKLQSRGSPRLDSAWGKLAEN
jgi:hypothetical protein